MDVKEFAKLIGGSIVTAEDDPAEREIEGCYAGDLLSRVISRAVEGGIWFTIMNNVNVAAVAHLADVACVVLCEDVELQDDLREKANDMNIPIIKTSKDVYTLITEYNKALNV